MNITQPPKQLWLLLCALFVFTGICHAASPRIQYNKDTNQLSVNASNVSFLEVLTEVARQTGVEIFTDTIEDHLLTTHFENFPLEKALKNIAFGTSYAFIYAPHQSHTPSENSATQKSRLTAMYLLGQGTDDYRLLNPAFAYSGSENLQNRNIANDPDEPSVYNLLQQRWETRLRNLPEEQREQLLEQARLNFEKEKSQREKRQKREAALITRHNELMENARLRRQAVLQGGD